MTTHARLSPSSRYRWQKCPASVAACVKYESEGGGKSSPAAIDGTHSHTLLEYCLKSPDCIADPLSFVGAIMGDHEGQFAVDTARAERVKVAVEYIKQQLAAHPDATVVAEQRVNPKPLVGRDDMSGTIDVQLYGQDFLEIIDYKDGIVPVEAANNPQLEQYAVGVMSQMHLDTKAWPSQIKMTIIQPKLAVKGEVAISSHIATLEELMMAVQNMTKEAAATDDPDAPFVPGEKQCHYCPNKGNCSAHNKFVLAQSGIKFSAVTPLANQAAEIKTEEMTDEQLKQLVESAPMMRKMIDAAEEEALRRITSGHPVAGLKVVRGVGRRAWGKDESEVEIALTKMKVPKGMIWTQSLVSPAQVQKLSWVNQKGEAKQLTARQLEIIGNDFIVKGEGKLTVVSESDRRAGVQYGDVGQMFAPVLPSWLS